MTLADHPLRLSLANELHARPFPTAEAPGWAAFLALAPAPGQPRDRGAERAHLLTLLDRHGAPHPPPEATHWFGPLGRHTLKWESHSEFVTYTLLGVGEEARPFDPKAFGELPPDWLAAAPGSRVTSVLVRLAPAEDDSAIAEAAASWFVAESQVLTRVLDDALIVGADFRIDPAGHMRFAVWARPGAGPHRLGQVVQRLCEIETYKAMAMLGFAEARGLGPGLASLEGRLSALVGEMAGTASPESALDDLLGMAAEIEAMLARSDWRFGATAAYEAIVAARVAALRESRFLGRQSFAEFLARRFEPAMRTASSTRARLEALAQRATRAGDLLRTRVDVERSAQNQRLLASMDRRADLALRLQHTVEGLSVAAISYYAMGLAMHALGPLAERLGEVRFAAVLTPIVVLVVWLGLRRLRRHLELEKG
jgi:uncharacterized membrane-anchored protein